MLDLIIRSGRVIDTKQNIDGIKDIGIKDGRIHCVENTIHEDSLESIDAKDCTVVPGLIDFHAHLFPYGLDSSMPYPDTLCFPSGVTTAIDAGSCGTSNYEFFKEKVINNSKVAIKSFLYISPDGQVKADKNKSEKLDPSKFDKTEIINLCKKYENEILGLKIKFSKESVGNLGMKPLMETLKIADEIGCRVVVHTTDLPVEPGRLIEVLRAGDIYCHVFQGKDNTIIGPGEKVLKEVKEGRKKGIIFDAANGYNNFDLNIARQSIVEGFSPDIISTDLSALTFYQKEKGVFSLPYVLSKYLGMGMNLKDVIKSCTEIPAKVLNLDNIGCLSTGTCADIFIFRMLNKTVEFQDADKNKFKGSKLIKPEVTIKNGIVVFRQIDF